MRIGGGERVRIGGGKREADMMVVDIGKVKMIVQR